MFEFIDANLSLFNSIGLFLTNCLILYVIYNHGRLIKVVESVSDIATDTFKGHHEHILLANRDKNCLEEVSSKTDPKFIREKSKFNNCGPFTTKERKEAGFVTRTEAAKG